MNTLKWLRLWFSLQPWIDAGLVQIVRSPCDLNVDLLHESMRIQEAKFKSDLELARVLKESVGTLASEGPEAEEMRQFVMLCMSDDQIAAKALELYPGSNQFELQTFMAAIEEMRNEHPYYVSGATVRDTGVNELISSSSGANFYVAKLVAGAAGAHLLTDLPSRWKEIELDRKATGANLGAWTPFAKAFHNASFRFLENVPLGAALTLRQEQRLENMRSFLRRVWRAARSEYDFDEANAKALTDELNERIREAEHEWRKIDEDLLKWFSAESAAALAAVPTVATGGADWLAGGWIASGLGNLAIAWYKRRKFADRYPAAFFLGLKRESGSK
jgi:hypothetical protein